MSGDFWQLLLQALLWLVPLVLSLTVHEYAHAYVAKRLGDDTAQGMGRLTLNPAAHADPMGTVFLPLMILFLNSGTGGHFPMFGWAKPVPVNGARFTRKIHVRTGMVLVAAAGPLANLLMAIACGGILSVLYHTGNIELLAESLRILLSIMIGVNVALFVFNMLPIYPLDGQKVVSGLLSAEASIRFERFNQQFGGIALLAVVFFGSHFLALPVDLVRDGLTRVLGLG